MQRIDTNSHLPFCLEKKIFALCIVNPMMIIALPWPLPSYDDYDHGDDDDDDGDDDDDDDKGQLASCLLHLCQSSFWWWWRWFGLIKLLVTILLMMELAMVMMMMIGCSIYSSICRKSCNRCFSAQHQQQEDQGGAVRIRRCIWLQIQKREFRKGICKVLRDTLQYQTIPYYKRAFAWRSALPPNPLQVGLEMHLRTMQWLDAITFFLWVNIHFERSTAI